MNHIIRTVFLAGLLALSADAAYSCTCLQISQRKEFRQAKAIFAGRVVEIAEDESYAPPMSPPVVARLSPKKRYVVRMKVERAFNGIKGSEVALYSFQGEGACPGISFIEGERYLVYASPYEGGLSGGGACSRTKKLDESSEEYRSLRAIAAARKWR